MKERQTETDDMLKVRKNLINKTTATKKNLFDEQEIRKLFETCSLLL